jgi:hypothetical protein
MSGYSTEVAFLAVMNAQDRTLGLPLGDFAGRNLLKRRIAVALSGVGHDAVQDEVTMLRSAIGKIIDAQVDQDFEAMIDAIEDAHNKIVATALVRVQQRRGGTA